MIRLRFLITISCLFICNISLAKLNLNIKLESYENGILTLIEKNIHSEFNKEIVISSHKLKNTFILNFKKFNNINVNGEKVNPIQINLKQLNQISKLIGKSQTITSFTNKNAHFKSQNINLSVDFSEIN